MDTIIAPSFNVLIDNLRKIDISVAARTEGRTTEQCERWTICRFLSTYGQSAYFNFPLSVYHRERPDFLIQFGTTSIGIEITEAISGNAAKIDAYRDHRALEGPFPMQRHQPDDEPLRGISLFEAAKSREFGSAWVGNEPEREWVTAMLSFISQKVVKSNQPGYELFNKNWLLIYDCWQVPASRLEIAANMLFEALTEEDLGIFQSIFIESSSSIWLFEKNRYSAKEINDLWTGS